MYFAAQAAIYLDLSQFVSPGATRRVSPFLRIFAGIERAGTPSILMSRAGRQQPPGFQKASPTMKALIL